MIATVVVSYKRPDLLRTTLTSYTQTVTMPSALLVVDNGGCDKAVEVALECGAQVMQLGDNMFPGHATNLGWDLLLTKHEPTYLHRSDNDVEYLPGWCDEVERAFTENPNLGQLGLRTLAEEGNYPNVGGNCVVTPDLFSKVRWQDGPWKRGRGTEDYHFTRAVQAAGYLWVRAQRPCLVHLGTGTPDTDDYYAETWHAKGYGGR